MTQLRETLADRWLWGAIATALLLRALPHLLFGWDGCVRDECSYLRLAHTINDGFGFAPDPNDSWLWAPGYPYLIALMMKVSGSDLGIRPLQIIVGALSCGLVYELARQLADRRAARIAAFGMALHPTLAYFAARLWSETVYGVMLLVAALLVLAARERSPWHAAGLGAVLGVMVLFRGVATYMAPIFALTLVWPDTLDRAAIAEALRTRWKHVAAMVVVMGLVVAPWSMHASQKYGGFVLSDASLGRMMYLGNNGFEPMSYDYGLGISNPDLFRQIAHSQGRRKCGGETIIEIDRCEVKAGIAHIKDNPAQFVSRIPLRVAQMLNPNTFLTRHLRRWDWHLSLWPKEIGSVYVILWSLGVMWLGAAATWSRAGGALGVLVGGLCAYHVAIVAVLAGLSRYRTPLEPFLLVFIAVALSSPRESVERLRSWRGVALLLTLLAVVPLSLWFLPSGFPGFWR